ncbi:MAG: PEP-CTERM sorting domain-containing protein [Lacipirellulaceae bacterium]
MRIKKRVSSFVAGYGTLAMLAGTVLATPPTYSVDFQGPTAVPPGGSGPYSAADILTPGAGPAPGLAIPAGFPGAFGTLAIGGFGVNSQDEVRELDALSYGLDGMFFPENLIARPLAPERDRFRHSWTFSVDEFAVGNGLGSGPSVSTEGAFGSLEASADVFRSNTLPGGFGPYAPGTNLGVFDGNGMAPFAGPTLNLVEKNPPTVGVLPDEGDNLDAWDMDTPVSQNEFPGNVYFSLDSFYPEPFEPGPPVNTGTAIANGFVGGDVLVSDLSGAPPSLFADSRFLGLNGGMPGQGQNDLDVDDLDALVLWNNDNPEYDPVTGPYSWLDPSGEGEGTDMLLFSLRRDSALLTTPTLDALGSGLEITEGDILVPVLVGPGTWAPGIFINAEALGIDTVRSGGGTSWGVPNPRYEGEDIWDDELDALDVTMVEAATPDANFDNDLDVDGTDFLTWQENYPTMFGATNGTGDADGDGDVDLADLGIWQSQYGILPAPAVAVASAVPEPTSVLLLFGGITALAVSRRGRC